MASIICDKCAAQMPLGSKFCPQCGDSVSSKDKVLGLSTGTPSPTQRSVKVVCPKCESQIDFQMAHLDGAHGLACISCKTEFVSKLAQVRSKKSREYKRQGRREFTIRVTYSNGSEDVIAFSNPGTTDFEMSAKDMVIFTYAKNRLRIVQNLNLMQFMKVSNPACYVATYAYGPRSKEVNVLRAWRDHVLLKYSPLTIIVSGYYFFSPILVRKFGPNKGLKTIVRVALFPVIWAASLPVDHLSRVHQNEKTG